MKTHCALILLLALLAVLTIAVSASSSVRPPHSSSGSSSSSSAPLKHRLGNDVKGAGEVVAHLAGTLDLESSFSMNASVAIWQHAQFGDYSDPRVCEGTPTSLQQQATGVCQSTNPGSIQYFCDSEGVYTVTYSDSACQTISQIVKNPVTCKIFGYVTEQFSCLNVEFGPSVPFAWPLPQSAITFEYLDSTTGDTTCPNSPNAYGISETAVPTNQCTPAQQGEGYQMTFCTEDSSYSGLAYYTDSSCTNLVAADLTTTSCIQLYTPRTQCVDVPPLAQRLPTAGWTSMTQYCAQTWFVHLQSSNVCTPSLPSGFAPSILECSEWSESSNVTITSYNEAGCKGGNFSSVTYTTDHCLTNQGAYFCGGLNPDAAMVSKGGRKERS